MAVSYGDATSRAEATVTDPAYTAPSGIVDGDLLLIWHTVIQFGSAPPTASAPGGFAAVTGWPIIDYIDGNGGHSHKYLWYKIASGESGSYTVTQASGTCRGIMLRVTGNHTTSPFEVTPTQNHGNGQTSTFLGLTTTVDSDLIVAFGADNNDTANNLTPPTGTTPTFTERVDIGGEYLATGVLSPAGPTGDKTMTNNGGGAGAPWYTGLLAIQAASGGPPALTWHGRGTVT